MAKYFSCGECCSKQYIYMYLSILHLIIHKILLGYSFDNEPIILLDNDAFSNHYLIHEIFKYFSCFIVALILTIKEKIDQKKI